MFKRKIVRLKEVSSVKFLKELVNKSETLKEQQELLKDCYYIEDVMMVVLNYGVYEQLNFAIMNNSEIVKGKMGDMIFVGSSLTSIEHIGIITRISNDGTLEYVTVDCNGETKFCETNIYSNRLKLSCSMMSLLKSRDRGCKGYVVTNDRVTIQNSVVGTKNTFLQKARIIPFRKIMEEEKHIDVYFRLFKDVTGYIKLDNKATVVNVNRRNELDLDAIASKVSKSQHRLVSVRSECNFYRDIDNEIRNEIYPMLHKGDIVYIQRNFKKDMVLGHVFCKYNGVLGFVKCEDLEM